MLAVNHSTMRKNFDDYCDKVIDSYETLIVTREEEKNVVLMSLEQYNSMIKTINNAEYLAKIDLSLQQLEEGKVITKTIEELEAMAHG